MGYVNIPGKGLRYKAADGKLYQDYRSALSAQGLMENPYTKSGFSATPSSLLGGASSAALSQLRRFGRAINEQIGSAFDPNYIDPASRRWLETGSFEETEQKAPPAPILPPPAVSGIDGSGAVDRRQSDLYRQYAQTPEGQFERYFKSSEMDPYFGAASRGAGAPKDQKAALALASQAKAPLDASLASYYRAQSAAGRGAMPEIVGGLVQGLEGDKAKAMETWAKANPMLAYREFNKRFPAGQPTIGPTPGALQADEALKGVTQFFPGAEPEAFNPTGFSGAANAVPAPWNTQGQAVSAPYTEAMSKAFDKTNPMNLVSQQPIEMNNEIGARVQDFLKRRGQ